MLKIKFLVIALAISFAGMFASCYYDYGIDPTNSDVVVTLYNTNYNFQAIHSFHLVDTVIQIGTGTPVSTDSATILGTLRSNLLALGWTETDTVTGPGIVNVGAGVTTSTVVVNSGDYWWGYYGYSWYYPPYYNYSYSYTTGTLVMLISDFNQAVSGTQAPIEWSGICNAALGQGTSTTTLIKQSINQSFSQSPYLVKH